MDSDQLSQSVETSRKIEEDYIAAMSGRLSELRALMKQQEAVVTTPKKRRSKN